MSPCPSSGILLMILVCVGVSASGFCFEMVKVASLRCGCVEKDGEERLMLELGRELETKGRVVLRHATLRARNINVNYIASSSI